MTKSKPPLYIDVVFDGLFFLFPLIKAPDDWEAQRDLYLSTGGQGSYLILVGIGVSRRYYVGGISFLDLVPGL